MVRPAAGANGGLSGTLRPPIADSGRLALATGVLALLLTISAVLAAGTIDTRPTPKAGVATKASEAQAITPSLRAAVERARYAIVPEQEAGVPFGSLAADLESPIPGSAYVAENPAQGLVARFTGLGISLRPEGENAAWRSQLELTGLAYGARLHSPPAATLAAAENRVELRRGALTEWYENRPRGLEQGFTLSSPPARDAQGPLVLRMTVGGDLRPRADGSGDLISFADGSGQPVLIYSGLHARDAEGRNVPARMGVSKGALSLAIDDDEAAYPLTIDPFVSQAKLEPPPSTASLNDNFGRSVAVSGDTALVGVPGAPGAGNATGAAYVFVRSGTSWSIQQKLTAPDGAALDFFGYSVALSGDTALVGIRGSDQNPGPGSAYVFVRSGTIWTFQQKLTASDGAAGDGFGQEVALDVDTAVVGALNDDNALGTDAGSAYVFTRSGTSWSLQQKLTAPDGADGDLFGSSVAVNGDTALVGARLDGTAGGTDAGSAYAFIRSGTSWSLQQKLRAPDGAAGDQFGWSVAVDGDTALVGAPIDDTAAGTEAGSVHVFTRSGTTWSPQQQLTAPDGAAVDHFGTEVALSGDTALISSPADQDKGFQSGSAYVFVRDIATWSLEQKLTAPDGQSYDVFGVGVALSGDTALVGAVFDDNGGVKDGGSAYVFVRSGTTWSFQRKLQLPEGALPRDGFGRSVALSGDTALVGSPNDDTIAGSANTGTAFVFVRSGTTWSLQQQLTAPDAKARDNFGTSVALNGDTALIGSPFDDNAKGSNAGSAYVFVRSGTTWSLQRKLTQPDGASDDRFGSAVRLGVDTALVGAPLDDIPQGGGLDPLADVGSAHVFVRSGTSWSFQRRFSRGTAGDRFGSSLGLSGDTALVGAPRDDTPAAGPDAGSAHVFVRSGTSWSFQRMLTAPAADTNDEFGSSAVVSGDTALVGARLDTTAAGTYAGSAYVFTRSGTSWSFQQQLIANDGAQYDNFGTAVALGIDRALVGAPMDDTAAGSDAGSVYFFTRSGTTWTLAQKLTAGDATASDRFGSWVAQSFDTFLVGSPQDGPNRTAPGAAYVFVGP